jgi:predicted dehydrogenase
MNGLTRKIKTGILGAGQANIATNNQLPATLAAENIELVALCDINPAVNDYARQHGVKAYTDYGAMLADPEIEMIQIATPDWLHLTLYD